MTKFILVLLFAYLAVICAAKDDKVISPEGVEAVPAEAGKLGERWGHGSYGYGHRHNYYYYPSYGYSGYYYPYYNRWYYRDGKPVPEDKAPPAPTSEPEGTRKRRADDKVISPEGVEAVPAEAGKLGERWGHGSYGYGHRHNYYYYPSYGNRGYYYPYYNRWYYRDGKPVPEDKAPPAPTSEPEGTRTRRAADKVISPEGVEAVPAEAGKLGERWGHGSYGYGHRHNYYYYPSYGYSGYYYPYYNRWYYRDGKPVPEDKAPPAPTSEPEGNRKKRMAEKVISPEGVEAVPAEPGKLGERWGHGSYGYGHRHNYYHYPSYGHSGYYYPYYNRWYYRDGKPVPEDKAPPAPTSEPEK